MSEIRKLETYRIYQIDRELAKIMEMRVRRVKPPQHTRQLEEAAIWKIMVKMMDFGWQCRSPTTKWEDEAEIDMVCHKECAMVQIQAKASTLGKGRSSNRWCFGNIRKPKKNKETGETTHELDLDFYCEPSNFLTLVGYEATKKAIRETGNPSRIRNHVIPMTGIEVLKYFARRSKNAKHIYVHAPPFVKDTPDYAKNEWTQREENFKGLIDQEEARQEREHQMRKTEFLKTCLQDSPKKPADSRNSR